MIVAANGSALGVLTPTDAQRIITARRADGLLAGAGVDATDAKMFCKSTDTVATVVERLLINRARAVVVTDADGKPERIVLDHEVVAPFTHLAAWAPLFSHRVWEDWLPRHTTTAATATSAALEGRHRSPSWSLPARTRSISNPAGGAGAGAGVGVGVGVGRGGTGTPPPSSSPAPKSNNSSPLRSEQRERSSQSTSE